MESADPTIGGFSEGVRDTMEGEIEDLMLSMACCRDVSDAEGLARQGRVGIERFNHAVPVLPRWTALSDGEAFLDPMEFRPTSMGPWTANIVTLPAPEKDDGYLFLRYRSLQPKEVRGHVSTPAQHYLALDMGRVHRDGRYWGGRTYFGWRGDAWWHVVRSDGIGPRAPKLDARDDAAIRMAQSTAFSKHWWWTASIGLEAGRQIAIATDAIGAREVFRLRDIPEGRVRRSALRHWVAEHARRRRKDPAEESKVRAHLRGATEFHWNGLHVTLTPSRADLDRDAEIRAARRA